MIECDCTACIVKQRAGRPKKKRRGESQMSTRNLTASYKCGCVEEGAITEDAAPTRTMTVDQ